MDKIDYMELRERWVNLIGFGDLEKIELNIFLTPSYVLQQFW